MTGRALVRSTLAVARAEFCERRRHYGFLVGLGFALFLCSQAASGRVLLIFGGYRGMYNSAWVGMMMALLANLSTLFVFYMVKGSVNRDQRTGVAQVLNATPLPNYAFITGKMLSNCAVLAAVICVFAVAAPLVQLSLGEDRVLHVWQLYLPLVLISLPAMAVTASLAVCFDMLPVLRGRIGNVVWVIFWLLSCSAFAPARYAWLNPIDGDWVRKVMGDAVAHRIATNHAFGQFFIDMPATVHVLSGWKWAGTGLVPGMLLIQLGWVAAAFAVPLFLMAASFGRVDKAPEGQSRAGSEPLSQAEASAPEIGEAYFYEATPIRLSPLDRGGAAWAFGRVVVSELRLAYSGYRWWWYGIALGLIVAQCTAPLAAARGPILASSWLWSVLTWSAMGSREMRNDVRMLLFSCGNIVPRQFFACYAAGLVSALITGAGVAFRLAIGGDGLGLFAWAAGSLLLASLAICLGLVSGSSKPFEVSLAFVWYAALNGVKGIDLTGAANGLRTEHFALIDFGLAVACLVAAYACRKLQLSDRWRFSTERSVL